MKIGMKGDMGDADEMALLVCRTARAAHVIAHEARQNALIRRLFWLEVKDCNENRHEGGYGRTLSIGIVGFGITCTECVILRKAHQKTLICSLSWLEVRDCNGHWYEGGHRHC